MTKGRSFGFRLRLVFLLVLAGRWSGRGGVKALQIYDPAAPLTPEQQELHLPALQQELQNLLGAAWVVDTACSAWTCFSIA